MPRCFQLEPFARSLARSIVFHVGENESVVRIPARIASVEKLFCSEKRGCLRCCLMDGVIPSGVK